MSGCQPRVPGVAFTAVYKLTIIAAANASAEPGEVASLLRREGLCGGTERQIGSPQPPSRGVESSRRQCRYSGQRAAVAGSP